LIETESAKKKAGGYHWFSSWPLRAWVYESGRANTCQSFFATGRVLRSARGSVRRNQPPFGFDAHPHLNPLPQERTSAGLRSGFAADRPANPIASFS
jgi:hypothetical protein